MLVSRTRCAAGRFEQLSTAHTPSRCAGCCTPRGLSEKNLLFLAVFFLFSSLTPQASISANLDIFANIQHVPGNFVHRLYQNGAFKFICQTFIDGNIWKPRDCRVRRTSPTEESYKEFTKGLTLILPLVQLFPTKTLERELLYFVAKQLPLFIFPPTRILLAAFAGSHPTQPPSAAHFFKNPCHWW